MSNYNISWENIGSYGAKRYICGHCGASIASDKAYFGKTTPSPHAFIYICHNCNSPTYFDPAGVQTPGPIFGSEVKGIPSQEVIDLYKEARKCASSGAYTASVLCCRKLLMNIAVAEEAPAGLKFIEYIDYLADKNFIPPKGKDWVDHIRQKGNEATHEIAIMKQEDAEELIVFIEILMKFIYEFPSIIKRKRNPS